MKAPFLAAPVPLLATLLLSGCAAVGPNYAAPELATPATW